MNPTQHSSEIKSGHPFPRALAMMIFLALHFYVLAPANAQVPYFRWAANPQGRAYVQKIAVDAAGNACLTGSYYGALNFGSTNLLTSAGGPDIFIAKYNSAGSVLWVKKAGGTDDDASNGIAVDPSGNIYVSGYFSGTATFDSTVLTGICSDIFVAKYNSAGSLLWVRQAGSDGCDSSGGIAVDGASNCYVVGNVGSQGTGTFGSITVTNEGVVVAKYDTLGNVLWAKQPEKISGFWIGGQAIAGDAMGTNYVTGNFRGTFRFGATTLTSTDVTFQRESMFVAKYDSAGNVLWAKQSEGSVIGVRGAAVDGTGNCYITGEFSGTNRFGTNTLISSGYTDIFVVKYDSAGNALWARQAGASQGDDHGNSIAVDAAGNSYVTGQFSNPSASFDGITLNSAGNFDVFVASYDPAGKLLWAVPAGGTDSDGGNGIALDAAGRAYIGGTFYGTSAAFGSITLTRTNPGAPTIFLARLDPPPHLTIIRSGANVILTWPTYAGGFALQSTTDLVSPALWTTVSPGPTIVNGQNAVTNPISGARKFYRLSQ